MKINVSFLLIANFMLTLRVAAVAELPPLKENPAVENLTNACGWINWERLVIKAVGISDLPGDVESAADALVIARAAAITRAYRNLAMVANSVRISGDTYVKNLLAESEEKRLRLEDFVQNGQIISGKQLCDRSYEIIIQAQLEGNNGLAPFLFPETHKEETTRKSNIKLPIGLVIDASGFDVKPCLHPAIFDTKGRKVFDAAENITAGLVAYSGKAKQAWVSTKNSTQPIIIKAQGKTKKSSTDLVISCHDAERIREADRRTGLLSRCRILVIIGSPK